MSKFDDDQPIPYSLGQPPQKTGLGGLSMKTTAVLASGFMLFLFLQIGGLARIGWTIVLPVTLIVAGLVTFKWGNRSLAEYAQILHHDSKRAKARGHVYVSGALSRVPGGYRRLPGLFARTEAFEGTDTTGKPFVMIVDRPRHEVTVVLDCQLTGQTAMTQSERNSMTAEWARWLANFSLSGDIKHVVTVVASRPGTGELINNEVASIINPTAPEIAQRIIREAGQVISVARPELLAHIAITVKVDGDLIKDNNFIPHLANRVPTWSSTLAWAGIMAEPMSYETAVSRIHCFYNPAAEADFEQLSLHSEGHGIAWENAGPTVAITTPKYYDHDGVRSVSWEMREAPRSTFEDTILRGMIEPHERVERKRVALVYRPFEAGAGASRVEAEHRDAMVAANSSKKITSAKAEMRLELTEAARQAQARGAQLGKTSLFMTATVADDDDIDRVCHDVEQLAAGSSIRLHMMRRQQDTGFQITCGFGQVPWDKSTTNSLELL